MSIRKEIQALPMDRAALRKFGLAVGLVFCLLGAFLLWRQVEWGIALVWIGGPLVLLGAIVPRVLKPIYVAWMVFAIVLGAFVTRVLLTIFFFVVLTPVGLFFRLIGRDALQRKIDRNSKSYWLPKEYPIADRSRLEKFF